jgi:hypothetical protein
MGEGTRHTGLASRLRPLEQARGRRSPFVIEREGDRRDEADQRQAELEVQGFRRPRLTKSSGITGSWASKDSARFNSLQRPQSAKRQFIEATEG